LEVGEELISMEMEEAERNVGIPSSKATRCSAGCLVKVPGRGSQRLCIETNELIDRGKP